MKILQISNYYPPHIGGIEQVACDISTVISGTDNEQRVFCFNHKKGDAYEEVDGVKVIRAGCFAKVASQSLSLSYGKLLKKTFKEFKPDVVIFHYPNPFAAHFLLGILKKYPETRLILYWHLDITKQKFLKMFFKGQNVRLCNRAELVLGATNIHLECSEFYEYFKNKCRVLPYCVDEKKLILSPDDIALAKSIRDKYSDKHILFAMGRHVPYKGMEYLIRASRLLSDEFVIFIAGEGPLTSELHKLAYEDKKIIFLGKINDGERRAYLKAMDIFCFPSITRNEAFGLALAEAMYFGKPAVTFTIKGSGVNYVSVNGVTGIEVENRNVQAYAAAIVKLSEDKMLYNKCSKAAKQRVEENFTAHRFKLNVTNLIENL